MLRVFAKSAMAAMPAIAIMAMLSAGAQNAGGAVGDVLLPGDDVSIPALEAAQRDAGAKAAAQAESNHIYALRALGRAESRSTGTTLAGAPESEPTIDRDREAGRAEARRAPESLGGGDVDREAIQGGATKGELCSAVRLKRDC